MPSVVALQRGDLRLEDGVRLEGLQPALDVTPVEGLLTSRNRSTFSCDIAHAVSRAGRPRCGHGLGVAPKNVVHPGLLGGWGC